MAVSARPKVGRAGPGSRRGAPSVEAISSRAWDHTALRDHAMTLLPARGGRVTGGLPACSSERTLDAPEHAATRPQVGRARPGRVRALRASRPYRHEHGIRPACAITYSPFCRRAEGGSRVACRRAAASGPLMRPSTRRRWWISIAPGSGSVRGRRRSTSMRNRETSSSPPAT
jgi:hypothetical protein